MQIKVKVLSSARSYSIQEIFLRQIKNRADLVVSNFGLPCFILKPGGCGPLYPPSQNNLWPQKMKSLYKSWRNMIPSNLSLQSLYKMMTQLQNVCVSILHGKVNHRTDTKLTACWLVLISLSFSDSWSGTSPNTTGIATSRHDLKGNLWIRSRREVYMQSFHEEWKGRPRDHNHVRHCRAEKSRPISKFGWIGRTPNRELISTLHTT